MSLQDNHDLYNDIMDEISIFNSYDDKELTIKADYEFIALYLGDIKLRSEEDFEILKHVKQMNRENGYF